MPVGSIIAWSNNSTTVPSDYLVCDGSIFNTAVYPKLYSILGSNKVPDMKNVLSTNLNGFYATGYETYSTRQTPVSIFHWGHEGKYTFLYRVNNFAHILHFNSFSDGLTYNWNIKWIIKAK